MFLRKLYKRAIWLEAREFAWLGAGEVCGDVLRDFKTDNGTLSVWRVDESNRAHVIAALASSGKKKKEEEFEMVLFSEDLLETIGVRARQVDGNTPDAAANTTWHFDIVELTVTKVAELATLLTQHGTLEQRYQPEVKQFLKSSLSNYRLDESLVDSSLLERLK